MEKKSIKGVAVKALRKVLSCLAMVPRVIYGFFCLLFYRKRLKDGKQESHYQSFFDDLEGYSDDL